MHRHKKTVVKSEKYLAFSSCFLCLNRSKQNSYGQSNYSQQESAYSQNQYDHPQSQVERVTEPYIPKKPARVKMNRNKPPPQKQRQPSPEPGLFISIKFIDKSFYYIEK